MKSPVEVMSLTFEGNFINVLTRDDRGYLHMVQVQNDPSGKSRRAWLQDADVFPADRWSRAG